MKTKLICIFSLLLTFNCIIAQNNVKHIVVYKSFWKAGTTSEIKNMFRQPSAYMIDTINTNYEQETSLSIFDSILKNSKKRKHHQKKIADIEIAGEFWFDCSDKHFFIYAGNKLIDFTAQSEYKITDHELLNDIKGWINTIIK